MIPRMPSRTPRRTRVRRAARTLAALAAMAALLGAHVPDASALPPPGTTATAPPGATADRVGPLFAGGLDGGHFCTASVVRSAGRNVIATAAHCLADPLNTVFAPGYRDGRAPYGVWRLTGVRTAPSWAERGDPDSDLAFATVVPAGGGAALPVEEAVGGFPVAGGLPARAAATVVGYPRTSEAPLRCTNTTVLHAPTQRRIACPGLSGGTSGSPWLAGGAVAGVLGGYEGGGTDPDVSYSAVMGDRAVRLYREAAGRA
ncbi:trypsin-like peptidase domain-containing protein [Streptomyces globosus]